MESAASITQATRESDTRNFQETATAAIVVTDSVTEIRTPWRVDWSGVFVGALTSIAAVSVLGFIGIALGAYAFEPDNRWVDTRSLGIGTLILAVVGGILAFFVGGWAAGKVAGFRRSEPCMLHGAISWLVAIPLLCVLSMLGAGSVAGGWFAGLSATPDQMRQSPYTAPMAPAADATADQRARYQEDMATYQQQVTQWNADTPRVIRNTALGGLSAMLLGLIGSVVGGWMAAPGDDDEKSKDARRRRPATQPANAT